MAIAFACSSYSKSPTKLSKLEREKIAFKRCSPIITEKLDVSAILPFLNKRELLTTKDHQFLTNKFITDVEKAEHLICVLPKIDGFFEKFMFCLCESKQGTGHNDIVKAMTAMLNEVTEGKGSAQEPQVSEKSDKVFLS